MLSLEPHLDVTLLTSTFLFKICTWGGKMMRFHKISHLVQCMCISASTAFVLLIMLHERKWYATQHKLFKVSVCSSFYEQLCCHRRCFYFVRPRDDTSLSRQTRKRKEFVGESRQLFFYFQNMRGFLTQQQEALVFKPGELEA